MMNWQMPFVTTTLLALMVVSLIACAPEEPPQLQVTPTVVEETSTPEPTIEPTVIPAAEYFTVGGEEVGAQLSEPYKAAVEEHVASLVTAGAESGLFHPDQVQAWVYVQDSAAEESAYNVALESTGGVEDGYPAGTIFVDYGDALRPVANPDGTTVGYSFELQRWVARNEDGQPTWLLADSDHLVPNPQYLERFGDADEQRLTAILELAKKGLDWQDEQVAVVEVTVDGQGLVLAVDPRPESALGGGVWGIWDGELQQLADLPTDYQPDTHDIVGRVEEGQLVVEVQEEGPTPEYRVGAENLTDELREANNFKEEQRPISNGEIQIRILRHQSLTENLPFEFNHEVITEQEFVDAILERWTATQASMFDQNEKVHINAIDWGWILEEMDSLGDEPRLPRANITSPETGQRRIDWLIKPFPYRIDQFDHITMIEMPARETPDRVFPREERSILGPDGKLLQVGLLTRGNPQLPGYFGTIVNHRPDGERELVVVSFEPAYGKENCPSNIPPINVETDDMAYYTLVARMSALYNAANHDIRFSCLDESIYKREASRLALTDANGQIDISLLQRYGNALHRDGTFYLNFFGINEFPISKHLFVFDTD